MVPVLKDEILQAQFDRDGFVKFRFFTDEQIKRLIDFFQKYAEIHSLDINQRSLHSTVETFDDEVIVDIDQFVRGVYSEQMEKFFQNVQGNMGTFLLKESGDDTELGPHQDLSFVDELEHCSFNIWVPLQKTGKGTGHLKVLKGSHKISPSLRVSPRFPWIFDHLAHLIPAYFTNIYTEIGDCVLINHAVIHGSDMNITGRPRLATIQMTSTAGADLYYYYWPDGQSSERIERYQMEPGDFRFIQKGGIPGKGTFAGYVSEPFQPVSEKYFNDWLNSNFGNNNSLWNKVKRVFSSV